MLFVLLVLWLVFAALGHYVALQKGRPAAEGLILGFLFGPLGCLIVAMLPAAKRRPGSSGRSRTRSGTVGAPEYRDDWDKPEDPCPDDEVEGQVLDFLNAAGGKPRDAIDLGAIADAARRPRADGGPIDLLGPAPAPTPVEPRVAERTIRKLDEAARRDQERKGRARKDLGKG
jgi:hypothetical protein